jgi:predicted lipoprotein with Yx(FWY)xxD motif
MWFRAAACSLLIALTFGSARAEETERPVLAEGFTLQKIDGGFAFADAAGKTLYVYDPDQKAPGTSVCTFDKSCSWRWPPVAAPDNAKAVGEWSVIVRPDKSRQWAFKGRPVYTYRDDLSPGALSGDNGGGGTWHALTVIFPAPEVIAPAGFKAVREGDLWFFADYEGRLVWAQGQNSRPEACADACLLSWAPVAAPMLARPVGAWTPVARPDGTRQWALEGSPLYVPADGPGAATKRADGWHTIEIQRTSATN